MGTSEAESIREMESRIDQMMLGLPLPAPSHGFSNWALLTTADDEQRLVYRLRSNPLRADQYVNFLDNQKYALKYALRVIRERLPYRPLENMPRDLKRRAYRRGSRLLELGARYRWAVAGFSSLHGGTSTGHIDDQGRLVFEPLHDFRYMALGQLDHHAGGERNEAPPQAQVLAWLAETDPSRLPEPVAAISSCLRRRGSNQASYRIEMALLQELDQILPDGKGVFPPAWTSRYGTGEDLRSFFRGFLLLAIYHELAVELAAHRFQLPGLGLASLVPVISTSDLAGHLARHCGLPEQQCRMLTHALVHGRRVTSPDPALQPLVPATRRKVLVPWMTIFGSAMERNFLTLLARIDAQEFDSASSVFEEAMTAEVGELVATRSWTCDTNCWLRSASGKEEVDVLLTDTASRTALLLELKWSLRPGESREIMNREQQAEGNVAQIERKVQFAHRNRSCLGKYVGATVSDSWMIGGALVTDGYLPEIAPSNTDLPVLPLPVLRGGVAAKTTLRELWIWLQSEVWLPVEGEHFRVRSEPIEFGDDTIVGKAAEPVPAGFEFIRRVVSGKV